jgi:hypothetical protein
VAHAEPCDHEGHAQNRTWRNECSGAHMKGRTMLPHPATWHLVQPNVLSASLLFCNHPPAPDKTDIGLVTSPESCEQAPLCILRVLGRFLPSCVIYKFIFSHFPLPARSRCGQKVEHGSNQTERKTTVGLVAQPERPAPKSLPSYPLSNSD